MLPHFFYITACLLTWFTEQLDPGFCRDGSLDFIAVVLDGVE
jgi:hypothetical protein